jgi:hypothetical protein
MTTRQLALRLFVVLVAGVLLIQLVPYGRNHANPPVLAEPAWNSPATRATAVTACFDCHSNETTWPWYSNIAPISWLLQRHVDEGRQKLNFSTWGTARQESGDIAEKVSNGQMPTGDYLLLHPEARLSAADKAAFVAGLQATFGRGRGEAPGGG